MIRSKILFLLVLVFCISKLGFSQTIPSSDSEQVANSPSIRVSVLTGGSGEELYSLFGHTAIRIVDSSRGSDDVYNYGVFDFSDPDFYPKFVLGNLLYFIDKGSFEQFMYEFRLEQRTVQEQVLNLPNTTKRNIQAFLENNLKPENRAYHYNFLADNCATRVRDIFTNTVGPSFKFGPILPNDQKISFRDALNGLMHNTPWPKFGTNLVLGSTTDKAMTDYESMFLPIYLHEGLANASYNEQPVLSEDTYLLSKTTQTSHRLDGPLWMMIGIFLLVALSFHAPAFRYLNKPFIFLLLFVSGLLGCIFLFLWLETAHTAFAKNFNVLWAFPPNIIVAFLAFTKKKWLRTYGILGAVLILLAVIISLIGLQRIPLFELAPFLMAQLYVYLGLGKSLNPSNPSTGNH